MKLSLFTLLPVVIASAMPLAASANDFATTSRVEYVLECMRNHSGNNYEYFYKCSCAIDEIAKHTNYEEFVQISTASRYLKMGGERGAEFRDPKEVKVMAKKYKDLEAEAANACFIQ